MIQLILALVALVIGIAVAKAFLRWFFGILGKGLGLVLALVCIAIAGVPALLGFSIEAISRRLKARLILAIFASVFSWLIVVALANEKESFDGRTAIAVAAGAFSSMLFAGLLIQHRRRKNAQVMSEPLQVFNALDVDFFRCFYTAFFLLVLAALCVDPQFDQYEHQSAISLMFWFSSMLVQVYAWALEAGCRSLLKQVHDHLSSEKKTDSMSYLKELKPQYVALSDDRIEALYSGVVKLHLGLGRLEELELNGCTLLFNKKWHQTQLGQIDRKVEAAFLHNEATVLELFASSLELTADEGKDYMDRHVDMGGLYDFEEGRYFIHYAHDSKVLKCFCCGIAVKAADVEWGGRGEWFCSIVCEDTETLCHEIHKESPEEFLSKAASSGFLTLSGAVAWKENHKVFAAGGQGHGFAAEKGNHRIDRLVGKDASIVGDDNAKNGADRLVNGQEVQTKYLSTGARSVGAGFDGQQGTYKYLDTDGKPMQLEVPRDQYPDAVKTMAKKIREGKVPGVTNEEEARMLIRKGHLTYDQAKNITKFGTIESLTYDVTEGVVVGLTAGGISFGVTAFISFLNTKDVDAALRVAVVQAGKTFTRSLTIYVGAQQLHRLAGVQNLLSYVDAQSLSSTTRDFLSKGFGVSKTGVTQALRGTVVTSIVVIAVTTGPDLLKLIRGRMSTAQFLKNLAVISSGVAGGVIGSVAGGAAGMAVAGPIGAKVGQIAGGIAGGMIAAAITNKVASTMMEEDRVRMLRVIQAQIEYLARTFVLSADELENLFANMDRHLKPNSLEDIFAASNKRAAANALIKPVVVSVVKQRPAISYGMDKAIHACDLVAA